MSSVTLQRKLPEAAGLKLNPEYNIADYKPEEKLANQKVITAAKVLTVSGFLGFALHSIIVAALGATVSAAIVSGIGIGIILVMAAAYFAYTLYQEPKNLQKEVEMLAGIKSNYTKVQAELNKRIEATKAKEKEEEEESTVAERESGIVHTLSGGYLSVNS
ncbi:MAG TPA: hypothetical protein VLF94_04570 [Chlamydiales bacterium]|nr:hypothetical protein [Chlamydiales bacterium]